MRRTMFPEDGLAAHTREIAALLADERQAAFGAKFTGNDWIGFIEVGQRDLAEGCATSPVGYIEAMWVAEPARRHGVARRLVEAAKRWARDRGFSELCSDAQIDNSISQEAHRRLGFTESDRIVCYLLKLGPSHD